MPKTACLDKKQSVQFQLNTKFLIFQRSLVALALHFEINVFKWCKIKTKKWLMKITLCNQNHGIKERRKICLLCCVSVTYFLVQANISLQVVLDCMPAETDSFLGVILIWEATSIALNNYPKACHGRGWWATRSVNISRVFLR